jgi:predicted amidophosphoribosyltransferase
MFLFQGYRRALRKVRAAHLVRRRAAQVDKHTLSSKFVGHYESGRPKFDTTYTEVGQALFLLKYRDDYSQVKTLAKAMVRHIAPRFENIGLVVPAPASTNRQRQPVSELAKAVAERLDVPYFDNLVVKSAVAVNSGSLKNMNTKAEKVAALTGRLVLNKGIETKGTWNALIIDDLFHTGATMEATCDTLSGYSKVGNIYVAALTWR